MLLDAACAVVRVVHAKISGLPADTPGEVSKVWLYVGICLQWCLTVVVGIRGKRVFGNAACAGPCSY